MASRAPYKRVLIVEDEYLIAVGLQHTLEAAGHEVVGLAADHPAAVAAALRHRPDLVLMDVRLARGTSGIDAAVEIRERTGIRSLFVSAHRPEELRPGAEAAEPLGWLRKPYDEAVLLAAISKSPGG